jgi:soluble lytic murein transglycosylase-like protein
VSSKRTRRVGPGHGSPAGRALLAGVVGLALLALPAAGSSETDYEKSVAKHNPIDVVSGSQVAQARRAEPGRALQAYGVIQGLFVSGDQRTILLQLVDNSTLEIECSGSPEEAHARARVRCLVKAAEASPTGALQLVDITWDKTPIELLQEAARAALKFPPKDPAEIARSAAELRRSHPMPGRGGNPSIICRQAIAYLNPRLDRREVERIADSIIKYSAKYNVDPYLVVAVIAAESRFNPNARSYKGAMGLGQLMPATAAAHGVNAYDPIANLNVAIRIIRKNLDKYQGDWNKALAAYNAGTGAVDRHKGVPPYRETRTYLWRIYEYWCWLSGRTPEPQPR